MQILPSPAASAAAVPSAATPRTVAPETAASPHDVADLGSGGDVHVVSGLPYAITRVSAEEASTAQGRSAIAERLINDMKPYPSVSAVIGMLPSRDGATELVVASRDGSVAGSELGGAWRLMRDLSSSPTVKAEGAAHPQPFQTAVPFDDAGKTLKIRVPGSSTEETLTQELREGGRPNQAEMLASLIENLPKGVRVAVLMAGPSAAGKSTLASQIRQHAGDRHVAEFPGDMYFRDADDPALPKTPSGGVYWDDPQAMHFDEMAESIARLVKDGHADIPVYDFSGVRAGGWHQPGVTGKGLRTDKITPLDIGSDDILVIDSLHAANTQVIDRLRALDLPHVTVYLDAERAEDRLVRRMVRDFDARGRSPQETLSDWDASTFPGEVHFVRPTLLNLDPGHDLALVNKFPNDLGLTREALDHKVAQLDRLGLAPSYEALRADDASLPAFARTEETRLRAIADDASTPEATRIKARGAADRIAQARAQADPTTSLPSTSTTALEEK